MQYIFVYVFVCIYLYIVFLLFLVSNFLTGVVLMPLVHRKKMMRREINQLLFLQLMPSMLLIYYASDIRSSRLHLFVIFRLRELMRL